MVGAEKVGRSDGGVVEGEDLAAGLGGEHGFFEGADLGAVFEDGAEADEVGGVGDAESFEGGEGVGL